MGRISKALNRAEHSLGERLNQKRQEWSADRQDRKLREATIKVKERNAYYEGYEIGRASRARKRGIERGRGGSGLQRFATGAIRTANLMFKEPAPRKRSARRKKKDSFLDELL